MNSILILNLFSTLAMTGLIWFVQIVHYPMFTLVGQKEFPGYEMQHQKLTTCVVAPLMITELFSTLFLWIYQPFELPPWSYHLGFILLLIIWVSTILIQVPCHKSLSSGFQKENHRSLVFTNWIRTGCWTLRGILSGFYLQQILP